MSHKTIAQRLLAPILLASRFWTRVQRSGEVAERRKLATATVVGRSWRTWACLAGLWLVFTAAHFLLLSVARGTVLREAGLGRVARISIACCEPILGWLVLGLTGFLSPARLGSRRGGRILRLLALAAAALAVALYAASWGMFLFLGAFLEWDSFVFVAASPALLAKHFWEMNVFRLLAGLGGVIVAALLVVRYAGRSLERASSAFQRRIVAGVLVFVTVFLCLVAQEGIGAYVHRDRIVFVAEGEMLASHLLWSSLAYRSGPLMHLLGRLLSPQVEVAKARQRIHRPTTAGELYRQQVSLHAQAGDNVLVIVVEALRADVLKARPQGMAVMPTVESLAARAITFTSAYSQANHSDYAWPCILSSAYPLRQTHFEPYSKSAAYPRVMIYDVLKMAGYRTAIVSSQNEHWNGMYDFLLTQGLDRLYHAETFHAGHVVDPEDSGFAAWTRSFGRSGKIDDADTVGAALDWVTSSQEPFFLAVNLQNSHFPYRFPADAGKYQPHTVDFPYTYGSYPSDKAKVVMNRYWNALSYVDAQIGRLLAGLGARRDHTIVVVTGDHGEGFYEHGTSGHGYGLNEEIVHVPMILAIPGRDAAQVRGIASHVDLPPTILHALRLPPHPAFQGHDLLDPIPVGRAAFTLVQTPLRRQFSIVVGQYKLISDDTFTARALYDLVRDPDEQLNVSGVLAHVANDLEGRLRAFRDSQLGYYRDQTLMQNEYPPFIE
jgi:arylsulfatase A-like enzyme